MEEISLESIRRAQKTIKKYVKATPIVRSYSLSQRCKGEVYLKLENQQHTNSFKVRGALNRMSQLKARERKKGVVTASSGNHAQGVAYAAQQLGIPATIVVPNEVSKAKLKKVKEFDVDVVLGGGFDEVEAKAREMAKTEKLTYVSPYNDYAVMAGQGTIGLEIIEEIDSFDSIVVPVGGGGLIAGIAVAVKSTRPDTQVIGVQTPGSATMYESWLAGEVVEIEESDTLAEAFLGGVEKGSLTLDVIMNYVDDIVLVDEETVGDAIRLLWIEEKQVIEGAGATAISPLLETPDRFNGLTVVCVVSGGNIEQPLFDRIVGRT
ncbi:MAG: threonine/serine dehydratase [Candidatus Thorarchaeota archaeon]